MDMRVTVTNRYGVVVFERVVRGRVWWEDGKRHLRLSEPVSFTDEDRRLRRGKDISVAAVHLRAPPDNEKCATVPLGFTLRGSDDLTLTP